MHACTQTCTHACTHAQALQACPHTCFMNTSCMLHTSGFMNASHTHASMHAHTHACTHAQALQACPTHASWTLHACSTLQASWMHHTHSSMHAHTHALTHSIMQASTHAHFRHACIHACTHTCLHTCTVFTLYSIFPLLRLSNHGGRVVRAVL